MQPIEQSLTPNKADWPVDIFHDAAIIFRQLERTVNFEKLTK
ncbi:hypothetical protein [Synergistes jonesii]|nr:hypothetical protein [Synergistes jonesii]